MTLDPASVYRAARDRLKHRHDDGALQEMRALADGGHTPAQIFLGWAYEKGKNVATDHEEAKRWYTDAAQRGDVLGQYYLGMYFLRRGEIVDGARSIRSAAGRNYVPALYRLGRLFEDGTGVEKNDSECGRCMREAASGGHPFAQRWIARRGLKGHDGVRGVVRALLWFATVPMLAGRFGWSDHIDQNMLDE